jgi:hypothetical protein
MLWLHVLSVVKTIGYALTGRMHFSKQRLGEIVIAEDGRQFTIFRQVIVTPRKEQPEKPGAIFRIRLQVTNMTPQQNKVFSLLPIPLYAGLPGFRSKLYTLNGRYCQSIYEWDTVQDAENYAQSFAIRFMTRRSMPGSVSYEVLPTATQSQPQTGEAL